MGYLFQPSGHAWYYSAQGGVVALWPKAHTTANESIAAGVEAAAEEESTTTNAEPAEAPT